MINAVIDNFNILAQCGPFSAEEFELVSFVYKGILFAAPALVLALCIVDMAKAVMAQDDGEIKKAQGRAVKRIIAGVAIFFVPLLINLFLGMTYEITDADGKTTNFSLGKDCYTQAGK